jgi:hypothetical protein
LTVFIVLSFQCLKTERPLGSMRRNRLQSVQFIGVPRQLFIIEAAPLSSARGGSTHFYRKWPGASLVGLRSRYLAKRLKIEDLRQHVIHHGIVSIR